MSVVIMYVDKNVEEALTYFYFYLFDTCKNGKNGQGKTVKKSNSTGPLNRLQIYNKPSRTHIPGTYNSGCNSRRKTIHIVAAFASNSCTSIMILFTLTKELRSNVGCAAAMEFMPIVGGKNHWPTGDR
jgi:hypothetical protein